VQLAPPKKLGEEFLGQISRMFGGEEEFEGNALMINFDPIYWVKIGGIGASASSISFLGRKVLYCPILVFISSQNKTIQYCHIMDLKSTSSSDNNINIS